MKSWQRESMISAGMAFALILLMARPAVAEKEEFAIANKSGDSINRARSLAQQPNTAVAKVTNVRVNSTDKGIEIILESANVEVLKPINKSEGNNFIADIPNAMLSLPTGKDFDLANPVKGIVSVTVTQADTNTVRVTVKGETGLPKAELFDGDEGLIFEVAPVASVAQPSEQPQTAAPEEKPTNEKQPEQASAREDEAIELVVTATRTEENLQNVPRTVTVIKREQIEQLAPISRDLTDIIGKLTPGAGPPTGTVRNQNLRGRPPQVLIDGVPVTSNDSNGGFQRDIRSISPDVVERVEIVRGPSAVYGDGATGGVINIITRKPSGQKLTSQTEIGVSASAADGSFLRGESFGNFFSHSISIAEGNFDVFALFSRKSTGLGFDAAGDKIADYDGTSETQTLQAFGKVGVDLTDTQRLQVTANITRDRIDPSVISDPSVDQLPFRRKAGTIPFDPIYIGIDDQQTYNTAFSLDYSNQDIFGSKLNAQAYYRYTRIVPLYFDGRPFGDPSGISNLESIDDKWGGRLQIETPLFKTANILWGVDYSKASIEGINNIFDPVEFDNSGGRVLRLIDKRTTYPRFEIDNLGLFSQLQWEMNPQWILSGGLRYERFNINVPDYINSNGDVIGGGARNLDDIVFNAGIVFKPTENISVYTNFSQGFSIPQIARILGSNAQPGFRFGRDVDISEPQKVNNYEIGVRGDWNKVQASIAAFYTQSELGTTTVPNPNNPGFLQLARAPQRNYGLEAAIDWEVAKNWQLGSTFTWSEGENDIDGDGDFRALSSYEVPPIKLTAYVQNKTTPGWQNRLQALYVGNRDRAFKDGSDSGPVDSYFVLDFVSSIKLGAGTLDIGIENLLNAQYTPYLNQVVADAIGNSYDFPARGRTVRATYRITW
jgi:iron complex outermembrane recepter protein